MKFSFDGITNHDWVPARMPANKPSTNADEKDTADDPTSVQDQSNYQNHGTSTLSTRMNCSDNSVEKGEGVDVTAEPGVQAVQAAVRVWTRNDLILAYVFMWLVQFFMSFSINTSGTLTPYVTSSFGQHSLTALTGVISSVVAGIWKLPYAKIMNIWGRPFALCLSLSFFVLGLVLMATCNNVKTYCAGQTFFSTGYHSYNLFMTVFIADTSKLKNRGLFIGYQGSPWMITPWFFGYAVNSIVAPGGIGFRWCYGIFSIITPLVYAPLIFVIFKNEAKARRKGLLPPRPVHGSFGRTIIYYLREFDAIGLLTLATGVALFLLAFNLYSFTAGRWKSPLIICFLIFGGLLIIAFGLWEKFCASTTFIPWPLLRNRTVIFSYTMAASLSMGWSIWNAYLFSTSRVMFNQTVPHATYIDNAYTQAACLTGIVYGLALRYYGKLKICSILCGGPLIVLGAGLMVKFCQPNESVGFFVMCMVFMGAGGGFLVASGQITLMAVSKQQDFPALLAVEETFIFIGNSIGSTIAGAIWTGVFPARLKANLPPDALKYFTSIYGSINVQTSYPVGSPVRDAIDLSYGQTQKYMLIATTCVYCVTWFSVSMWQNIDVRKLT